MSEEKKLKRPKACVGVMVFKDGKILIGKRRATASHGVGEYTFPGGHIEHNESFIEATEREAQEEAGIKMKNLKFQCVINTDVYKDHQAVLVAFVADWDSGEPRSLPEENVGEWSWYNIDELPAPLFYPTEIVIDSFKTGKNFYDKE
ncbi:MAG: NUDIX domain-containing protein [bacterium]